MNRMITYFSYYWFAATEACTSGIKGLHCNRHSCIDACSVA